MDKIKAFFSKADKNESYNRGKELFLKEIRRRKKTCFITRSKKQIIRKIRLIVLRRKNWRVLFLLVDTN